MYPLPPGLSQTGPAKAGPWTGHGQDVPTPSLNRITDIGENITASRPTVRGQ